MIAFCCGCTSKLVIPLSIVKNDEGEIVGTRSEQMVKAHLATFDAVAFDPEGFMVCAIHRQRRRGWRSVPYTATTAPYIGMGLWTELQYEEYVVFGRIPEGAKKNVAPAR